MQNLKKAFGGYTTVSPLEARRLAGFPTQAKVLLSFENFVRKRTNN